MANAPVVTLHGWAVRPRSIPAALLRVAVDRRALRRLPGATFAKVLGTGSGRTFTPSDADPVRWAILACWSDTASADGFESSRVARRWDALAHERLAVRLAPLSSRGAWSRRQPFGPRETASYDGPVAAVTRARLRPAKALTFWRATPPVVAELAAAPGLVLSFGIGEAPIGLQGTFSLWESAEALRDFAYRGRAHADVVRRTPRVNWYAEELFARFAVVSLDGVWRGRRPLIPSATGGPTTPPIAGREV